MKPALHQPRSAFAACVTYQSIMQTPSTKAGQRRSALRSEGMVTKRFRCYLRASARFYLMVISDAGYTGLLGDLGL